MYMRGTPCIVMILPRISAGLDRDELIISVDIRQGSPCACEIRIQWRGMFVLFVKVAAGGIGLPDFHERMRDRTAPIIDYPAPDNNAFGQRLPGVLAR